jgi:predicted ATPase
MATRPTGTVTFLFTDIEGSTRLLRELGHDYAPLVADHRRAVREALVDNDGIEVDTQGDAFFCAFARASDALGAAEAIQHAPQPLRVRIGIHTGEAELTEEGYVGIEVVRAARICAAAHGGQTLVSEATRALVTADLRDLGVNRLKDVGDVRLFQLGGGGFPPLRTLNQTNLPLSTTALLGRDHDLADVLGLFREGRRHVSVTGPPGVGKTRFALEVAAELVGDFTHGVWFVDLSAVHDGALVVPAIATALGATEDLAENVADRELLLVLDNFEHVVSASADVARLLGQCPGLAALVTTREPLRIAGEQEYALLALGDAPSIKLFRERATAVRRDFASTDEQLALVCRSLDNLPLAIELAAARVRTLSPNELLNRLAERLPLLVGQRRDLPERQRTLTATIAWSYDLLTQKEQDILRRLSVFAGGFTLEAAETICGADDETLESLVEKNLVRHEVTEDAESWFTMLETIQEFGSERLSETGKAREASYRHAEYYAGFVEQADYELRRADRVRWRARRAREHDNVRVAARRTIEQGAAGPALRLATFFGGATIGHPEEWQRVLDAALRLPDGGTEPAWTRAARAAGWVFMLDDGATARRWLDQAVREYRGLDDASGLADSLAALGSIAFIEGDVASARLQVEEALAVAPADDWVTVEILDLLSEITARQGRMEQASELRERGISIAREAGYVAYLPGLMHGLADLDLDRGDLSAAADLYRESMRLSREFVARRVVNGCLCGLAAVAAQVGDATRAGRLWGATERLEHDMARPLAPALRERYERIVRTVSGDPAFAAATAEGRQMTMDDAIDEALD